MPQLGQVRAGEAADAVDGVHPRQVLEPRCAEDVASGLAWASRERLTTVLRGGGTKLGWGRVPASVDLVVSTARLNQSIAHRHADLTVTADAGVTLVGLNRELARYGQWLPVESAFENATVGGIVATNDAGPSRHRYGTPRDLLIGITLGLTDGRLVKSGGRVVKNVAGYDLAKLVSGSFGTLAAIADATFKLMPVPRASGTLVASYPDAEALVQDVTQLQASQIELAAFDLRAAFGPSGSEAPHRLLLRCASSAAATAAQLAAARAALVATGDVVTGEADEALWREQRQAPWVGTGGVIRLSWLPARLLRLLTLVEDAARGEGVRLELAGRVGVGAGLLRVDAPGDRLPTLVGRLRAATAVAGHVVLLRASAGVRERVDVWGAPGGAMAVLQAMKRTLDPADILNAGRGPI